MSEAESTSASVRQHTCCRFALRFVLVAAAVMAVLFALFWMRLETARFQRSIQLSVAAYMGAIDYDYEVNDADEFIPNAKPPGPAWLREQLGLEFFSRIVVVRIVSNPTDALLSVLGKLSHLRTLTLENYKTRIETRGDGSKVTVDARTGIDVTDAGLEHLKGLSRLRVLSMAKSKVTDAGVEHLKGLKALQELDLGYAKITEVGLKCLKGLPNLRTLKLYCIDLTDSDMRHLARFSQLQSLNVSKTKITDAGLASLVRLRQLRDLRIACTEVTDAGLEHIKRLPELRSLYLKDTKVTDQGVQRLREALPDCEIVR